MARLTIRDLHKYYGPVHAVRGFDLDIPEGEFAVLVGPSGCGKSTLLRPIAGLEPIDRGTITIDGEVINQMRLRDHRPGPAYLTTSATAASGATWRAASRWERSKAEPDRAQPGLRRVAARLRRRG